MRLNKALLPRPRGVLNKALLTQKAMSESQKQRELAEIDRLLDELEKEDLFSAFEVDGDTKKGAGHKYVRKYRHGNGWRYVYANKGDRHSKGSQISHSRVIGKDEHMTEGSHYSLGAGKGHMVIEKVDGDKITYSIDGKGKKTTVSKQEFKGKVLEAHRGEVETHAKAGLERREDILQRARKVDPNSKQAKRAEKELARWKEEASHFLPPEQHRNPMLDGRVPGEKRRYGKTLPYKPSSKEMAMMSDEKRARHEFSEYIKDHAGLSFASMSPTEKEKTERVTNNALDKITLYTGESLGSILTDNNDLEEKVYFVNEVMNGNMSWGRMQGFERQGRLDLSSLRKFNADREEEAKKQREEKEAEARAEKEAQKKREKQAKEKRRKAEKERQQKLNEALTSAKPTENEKKISKPLKGVGSASYQKTLKKASYRKDTLHAPDGDKWATDGHMVLLNSSVPDNHKAYTGKARFGRSSIDTKVQQEVDSQAKSATEPVFFQEKGAKYNGNDTAFLRAGSRQIEVNADLLQYVHKNTKADSIFADPSKADGALVLKKGKEVVGLVMPMLVGSIKRQGDTKKALGVYNASVLNPAPAQMSLTIPGVLNKALLTQKAMSESQKQKELAEIDRLLDELEKEDLFSAFEVDGDTKKGAGHKYVRKYRHGNGWRYVYANKGDRHSKGSQISHSRVLGKDEHLAEGSHYSLGADKGHMVIEKVDGDKITYSIDGKGEKTTVSKQEFKGKVLEAHRSEVETHAKAGLERREDILQRARKVDPNSKQAKRAEKELARWKEEAKDFLPGSESDKEKYNVEGMTQRARLFVESGGRFHDKNGQPSTQNFIRWSNKQREYFLRERGYIQQDNVSIEDRDKAWDLFSYDMEKENPYFGSRKRRGFPDELLDKWIVGKMKKNKDKKTKDFSLVAGTKKGLLNKAFLPQAEASSVEPAATSRQG